MEQLSSGELKLMVAVEVTESTEMVTLTCESGITAPFQPGGVQFDPGVVGGYTWPKLVLFPDPVN